MDNIINDSVFCSSIFHCIPMEVTASEKGFNVKNYYHVSSQM